ncbi:MAG TPA: hypothetical protein PLV25_02005, partial [Opitutales bacterium]|nr:hypothetical protein [Opitutales bacterium]
PKRPRFVQKILEDVTALIRAEVATRYPDQLDSNLNTVPNELKQAAAQLVIEALVTRIPGVSLSEDQARGARGARHLLERVARGYFCVSLFGKQANGSSKKQTIERMYRALGKLTATMFEGL